MGGIAKSMCARRRFSALSNYNLGIVIRQILYLPQAEQVLFAVTKLFWMISGKFGLFK
jgi:hypothetical protein